MSVESQVLSAFKWGDPDTRVKPCKVDFRGGPGVKNGSANAGDTGGKIPQASGQLRPAATATEPARSKTYAPQQEKQTAPRSPRAATGE